MINMVSTTHRGIFGGVRGILVGIVSLYSVFISALQLRTGDDLAALCQCCCEIGRCCCEILSQSPELSARCTDCGLRTMDFCMTQTPKTCAACGVVACSGLCYIYLQAPPQEQMMLENVERGAAQWFQVPRLIECRRLPTHRHYWEWQRDANRRRLERAAADDLVAQMPALRDGEVEDNAQPLPLALEAGEPEDDAPNSRHNTNPLPTDFPLYPDRVCYWCQAEFDYSGASNAIQAETHRKLAKALSDRIREDPIAAWNECNAAENNFEHPRGATPGAAKCGHMICQPCALQKELHGRGRSINMRNCGICRRESGAPRQFWWPLAADNGVLATASKKVSADTRSALRRREINTNRGSSHEMLEV